MPTHKPPNERTREIAMAFAFLCNGNRVSAPTGLRPFPVEDTKTASRFVMHEPETGRSFEISVTERAP